MCHKYDSKDHSNNKAPKAIVAFDVFMAWGFILFGLQLLPEKGFTKLFLSFLSAATIIIPLYYPNLFKKFSVIMTEIIGGIIGIILLLIFICVVSHLIL